MKNFKILWYLLLIPMFLITSCEHDSYELGRMLDKDEIKFSVIQDRSIDEGGNTVILINETPGTVAIWDYGTGRSNRAIDTVKFAFQGEYQIKLSVMTAGGVVQMDPVTIQVTEDNLNYVNDPLWTALTGGVGEEKTWILDIEAKYFDGPLYFYGTENGWQGACMNEGGDCWNWNPVYADNTWLMPNGDYGTMTFSLKGGPYVTVNHLMLPSRGTETGTFFLDVNTKTLSLTDATPLHDASRDGCVDDWGSIRLISLTEDAMQFAVMRKNSCEGAALLVYNFVSKEYADNWVPEEPEETGPDEGFDPEFTQGELLAMLTGGPSSGRVWTLDAAGNPVDWIAAGKGWTTSSGDSRDWGWNNSWDAAAEDSWIRFDRFGGTQNYTRSQNGVTTTGTFTINEEENTITLNNNTLIQNPDSWMNPTTNTIKVVKAFPGEFESKGVWFGTSYDASKDEWLAFHYVIP
ncbi:hypothetical protein [Pontibacter harenae]|uniref:hypothetical protein n=1 Tax=Pontibacter harenae TaxID=2894083 RepID=UPI001E60D77C|nr:hypothetical protein [Pontibacter harenae]MCC9167005.1 hypothetical protein [Pontibacter harenae]